MGVLRLIGGVVLAMAVVLPAQAQWKWKDGAGQVHISDMPPPRDIAEKDILQRPTQVLRRSAVVATQSASAASGAEVPARPKGDAELEARKAKQEAEQKAKTKAEEEKTAALRAENCQRARQHLTGLQSGQRMSRVNAKGEREVMDDQGRAQEMQSTQRVIDSECR